jgi:hypothetical protein
MTEQQWAESFLQKHPGRFFCAACLAHQLGLTALDGRSLLWTLQALPGYEMHGGRCMSCLRGKRVIRHVGGVSGAGAKGEIVAFLLGNGAIDLCDACLAFATELSLADVRHVLDELTPFAEFRRHEAICAVCSRMKPVTSATVDVVDDSATRPEEMRTLVTRTELYRNWRIDLLSYRISTGWRPLVLVKGPAVSLTSDTPSLLWGTFRSKTEADRYALQAAREWIDKHSGE